MTSFRQLTIVLALLVSVLKLTTSAQVTVEQVGNALEACEDDLDSCRSQLKLESASVRETQKVYEKAKGTYDNLINTYKSRIMIQDSVTSLLKTNANTFQAIVNDYKKKLDEVDKLYRKELQKQSKPWFLTPKGWQGLLYGVLAGSVATTVIIYNASND